jgi:hypothetical protein
MFHDRFDCQKEAPDPALRQMPGSDRIRVPTLMPYTHRLIALRTFSQERATVNLTDFDI